MDNLIKKLKDMGLTYRESDVPDRMKVDFAIEDGNDNVCWCWGKSADDLEVECDHPVVEYDDDETVGECVLCGDTCDWHYETNYDDGYKASDRVPHAWHRAEKLGGILGRYF